METILASLGQPAILAQPLLASDAAGVSLVGFGFLVSLVLGGGVILLLSAIRAASPRNEPPGRVVVGFLPPSLLAPRQPYVVSPTQRFVHLALSGATGSGKSTLLEHLVVSDMRSGAGLCVIDPKDSTLLARVLSYVPPEREKDVILFDATDPCPIGLNPLADVPPNRRTIAVNEILSCFQRSFAESWGVRLQNTLRNCLLALVETPGATLLDIPRLLLEPAFTDEVLQNVTNPGVREFFRVEFEQILRRRGDAVEPILNKIGAWLVYPELRGIFGQSQNTVSFTDVMNTGKILLVRIPQGALGEEVSTLLGALIVAKLQLAAHGRVDLPPSKRRPFFLYVDEFQNFATSSFAKIITELRSFKVGLVCANQFPEQLSRELQLAIRHNVGIVIQCQYRDRRYVLQLDRLDDRGPDQLPLVLDARSPLPAGDWARVQRIRALSRKKYGRPRAAVEGEIQRRATGRGEAPRQTVPKIVQLRRRDVDED